MPPTPPTKTQIRMGDEHRLKIKNSNILNALIKHVEGKREMSSSQVSAGLGLLGKVLPNLTAVDANVTGNVAVTIERIKYLLDNDEDPDS